MDTINIMGCGRAAGSLARLWLQAGSVQIGGVLNRSRASSQKAVEKLGTGEAIQDLNEFQPSRYWLIGTSDSQIEPAARALSKANLSFKNSIVFHLCGRHSLNVLEPLKHLGCAVAAVHPVRSLTHNRLMLEEFAGTACVAEGEAPVLNRLRPLFDSIGGVWMPVQNVNRGLYHASVSIISNITKAVAWKAQYWLVNSGLTEEMAAEVTQKLLSSTLEDITRSGAKQSITGPVVRGDTRTIEAHLEALREAYPRDLDVYRVLALTVLELAEERGDLDADTLKRFEVLLGRTD